MGLVDDPNGGCVEKPVVGVDNIEEPYNFTLTPGNIRFLATWEADALVSYYTIEKWREGRSWPQKTTTVGNR